MATVDWNAREDARLAPKKRMFERVACAIVERRCPMCGAKPLAIVCDAELWVFCPSDRVKDRIGIYPALSADPAVREAARALARQMFDGYTDAEFPREDERQH